MSDVCPVSVPVCDRESSSECFILIVLFIEILSTVSIKRHIGDLNSVRFISPYIIFT